MIFWIDTKSRVHKNKNKQMGLHQTKTKEKTSAQQRKLSPNEKATYGMGENICKSFI